LALRTGVVEEVEGELVVELDDWVVELGDLVVELDEVALELALALA
jgi:hypothetical protein